MAVWQVDFHVVLSALPPDYPSQVTALLPRGRHWSPKCEMWGTEDGDRVDICADETPPKLFVRFDLRTWRPDLYERFLAFVRGIGGTVRDAETGADVPLTAEAFLANLRSSRAARFVLNPEAYFEELRANPIRMDDEP